MVSGKVVSETEINAETDKYKKTDEARANLVKALMNFVTYVNQDPSTPMSPAAGEILWNNARSAIAIAQTARIDVTKLIQENSLDPYQSSLVDPYATFDEVKVDGSKEASKSDDAKNTIDAATANAAIKQFISDGFDGKSANDKAALDALRSAFGIEGDAGYSNPDGVSTGDDFITNAQYDALVNAINDVHKNPANLDKDGNLKDDALKGLSGAVADTKLTKDTAEKDNVEGVLSPEQRAEIQKAFTGTGVTHDDDPEVNTSTPITPTAIAAATPALRASMGA